VKRRGCRLELEAARFTPGYLHSRVERIRVKGSEGAPAGVFEESFWRWLVERLGGMVEEARSGTNQLGGKGLRVCCWLLAELDPYCGGPFSTARKSASGGESTHVLRDRVMAKGAGSWRSFRIQHGPGWMPGADPLHCLLTARAKRD
jgi:hypothetical protein